MTRVLMPVLLLLQLAACLAAESPRKMPGQPLYLADKPQIAALSYDLLRAIIKREARDWILVPTKPVIVDEIALVLDLPEDRYKALKKTHANLAKLRDIYFKPGWGHRHRASDKQAWLVRLVIRYCNQEGRRLYNYHWSAYCRSEAAHGGTGTIDFDAKAGKFVFSPPGSGWES